MMRIMAPTKILPCVQNWHKKSIKYLYIHKFTFVAWPKSQLIHNERMVMLRVIINLKTEPSSPSRHWF